ncbi:hypothetical protein CALVIDRAFT_522151 [Calocera viscosa TUFC12733]|uniref:Concanavalin A-like lectin/glucanase n=1 Tax=Calocera viscosa (strain TUFC12733) TaxID=1330018 RepID=A0A167GXP1_CALVF|nr:hypothetical protein CALVIDRAFT_522151 [Calocera viscosa TUFC12733]
MLSLFFFATLALLVRQSHGVSWGLFTPSGNSWIQLVYTIHVPPAPPAGVTTGPWYFWCGLQPSGGGVIQPVLGWMASEPSVTNPTPSFPEVWAINLWALPWNYGQNGVTTFQESEGIWVDQNAQIASSVTWENGAWSQTAQVISGAANGQSISLSTSIDYFEGESSSFDNTNFALCESELDGSQTDLWDFSVTFTDVYFRAASSDGIEALCASATDSDHFGTSPGTATFSGFSMFDDETCHWSSIVLSPS